MRQLTVDQGFQALDTSLNLDPTERAQAQSRHRAVEGVLLESGVAVDTFLQGSFARKTMLAPLKDVDIVIVLHPRWWEIWGGADGPGRAMEAFKAPIRRRWPTVRFDDGEPPSGKALRLSFDDVSFTVDLVPAFDSAVVGRDGGDRPGYVLIGDRHQHCWEPSNTRIQIQRIRERNVATTDRQGHDGRFVHQVRELKAAVKNTLIDEFVKGIVSESLMYWSVNRRMRDRDAIRRVLRYAADAVRGPVLEPAGDDDLTVKWTPTERSLAVATFGRMSAAAEEAIHLEAAGDPVGACSVWHGVFGDQFPAPPDRDPEDVLVAWGGAGSLTSSGRPSGTAAGRQRQSAGRAWAPR